MSPLNHDSGNWDPERLRIQSDATTFLQGGTRKGHRLSPIQGKFIKGPIDVAWVCQASHLGVKALLVGLALWHLKGLRKADTFTVSNLMLQDWGVLPDAKSRALRKMERAGLITVERRGKRSPRVTLCASPRPEGSL